ncbi:MAG TPA: ribonuclease D [Rudaea sp.]
MSEWIATREALARWMESRNAAVLGIDTEFMRTDTFLARLALVQINIGGDAALIDAPAIDAPTALVERLSDPAVVSVMHSASEDLEALAAILPNGPANLFDTQIAAAMAGLGYGLSYQKLVAMLLGIDLPKAETRSDWLARPLSASQIEYAVQDVVHLPTLHEQLTQKLAALGRSEWLAEDCRRLVARVCLAAPDPQPQRAFRTAYDWPRDAQVRLRRILLWRESAARRYDKPRPWLLDDARVLQLALDPPPDDGALFERTKGLRAFRNTQRKEVFELLHAPIGADDEADTAPIPPPFDSAQKRALAAMKQIVATIAEELQLPEGLLCPRRHLESFVTDRIWPAALEGWRSPLLREVLTSKLP